MAEATPTTGLGFDNFFSATLTGDITASSTDILMDTIPTSSEGFLVIEPDSTSTREIIYYNSKTALKVVCPSASTGRGQGGTTAGAHSTGATVICAPIAEMFEALQNGYSINAKAIKFNTPQGFLQNGVITRSVASNNITVAIKTLAGSDPSASDPVLIRIGDTVRTLTSALSVTKNAGTNWFSKGASYFGGAESDFFVYLCWNTTDSAVTIAFSSIPDGRLYSDFSTTNTNWNYWAGSGSAPASTDVVENVGRFNATLGVTASFNWSVPGTSIVINRPIFETRIFSTTNSGSAGGTIYWQQQGAKKRIWGATGSLATVGAAPQSAAFSITFPAGFLTTLHTAYVSAALGTASGSQYIYAAPNSAANTTSWSFYVASTNGSGATTSGCGYIVEGI